jgi:hypothetical protein
LLNNIYRTPVSGVFRRKDSGFAVCGEKPASVSQFVAGIRHGRSSQQEQDEDDGAVWLQEESARLHAAMPGASSSH